MRLWLGGALMLLVLALPPAVSAISADAPPRIVDIKLDGDNHAVVTWTMGTQRATNVKWTTVDGTTYWPDGTYGSPLTDCQSGMRANPGGDSQWLYGVNCKGDDVSDSATRHVTRGEMEVGVYYFQVATCGDTIHSDGYRSSCARHFSNVVEFTVDPSAEEEALGEAKVTGTVYVRQAGDSNSEPVRGTLAIGEGTVVHARTAPARLTFQDGSALVLDRRSTVSFDRTDISNQAGRVWYSLKGNPRVFFKRIDFVESGYVLRPRSATFTISNQGAKVRVYSGAVTVGTRGAGTVRVPAGFETKVVWPRPPAKPRPRTAEKPFWK